MLMKGRQMWPYVYLFKKSGHLLYRKLLHQIGQDFLKYSMFLKKKKKGCMQKINKTTIDQYMELCLPSFPFMKDSAPDIGL